MGRKAYAAPTWMTAIDFWLPDKTGGPNPGLSKWKEETVQMGQFGYRFNEIMGCVPCRFYEWAVTVTP